MIDIIKIHESGFDVRNWARGGGAGGFWSEREKLRLKVFREYGKEKLLRKKKSRLKG